jgi:hypothetical protein
VNLTTFSILKGTTIDLLHLGVISRPTTSNFINGITIYTLVIDPSIHHVAIPGTTVDPYVYQYIYSYMCIHMISCAPMPK